MRVFGFLHVKWNTHIPGKPTLIKSSFYSCFLYFLFSPLSTGCWRVASPPWCNFRTQSADAFSRVYDLIHSLSTSHIRRVRYSYPEFLRPPRNPAWSRTHARVMNPAKQQALFYPQFIFSPPSLELVTFNNCSLFELLDIRPGI